MQERQQIRQQGEETAMRAEPTGIDRRTLLVRGSAGALGVASLGAWSSASASPHASEQKAAQPFSIGYWDSAGGATGNSGKADFAERPFRPDVVAAHHLPSGNAAAFGDQAEVIVHGLFGESLLPRPDSLALKAYFTIQGKSGPVSVPFRAWHYAEGPLGQVNHSVRFHMPVFGGAGLRFSVSHPAEEKAPSKSMTETFVHLAEGGEQGAVKLRSGVYFLALHSAKTGFQPNWSRYQFRTISAEENSGPNQRLYCRTLSGVRPVEFDYLIVSISPVAGGVYSIRK